MTLSISSIERRRVLHELGNVKTAIGRMKEHANAIDGADDFLTTPWGVTRLEASSMLIITVGECLKSIDKMTQGQLLPLYPDVAWKQVKGMRDIIAHNYFEIDAEIVFQTIKEDILDIEKGIDYFISILKADEEEERIAEQ